MTHRLTSIEARQIFLDFFAKHDHKIVASSSLVPGNDPSLLFTNAGMVQFKDVFLGLDQRPYKRATTSQKCMRISGKHNDLENVGPSPRHHTFFEMLGNFSFGDYFKQDAIRYAFDLLTKEYEVEPENLYYTVYQDDDNAFDVWTKEIGISPDRVYRMGPKTNFWQMAETGPCGPTSEIHYDWGKNACTCHDPKCSVELDNGCERWLEIWNLVFMQFNRTKADPKHTGKFDQPLPAPGVDTGMGLERILAVLQGAPVNYDTDLFADIMDATQEILRHSDDFRQTHTVAYRVIADHTRAATFLIADGVNPGTTGREYITRMLIRRAWRFAHSMGVEDPFLSKVAEAVIDKMSDVYSELRQFEKAIHYQISAEEDRFIRTLDRSLLLLEEMIQNLREQSRTELSGTDAFFLYETHGLPMEITRDLLKEEDLSVNEAEFQSRLQEHKDKASTETHTQSDFTVYQEVLGALKDTNLGYNPYDYDKLSLNTNVVAIIKAGKRVAQAKSGDTVEIVLQDTPFYVESGGQVSDTGLITGSGWQARISDMSKPVGGVIVHHGEVVTGKMTEGDTATASVDSSRRWDIMRNHTATHLLHASLRRALGEHVRQKGSLVAPDRLRFDFTHNQALDTNEIERITWEINLQILANRSVQVVSKPLAEAKREGAMALFGEKYGETVRTVSVPEMGDELFSYELCGGTHVRTTAEIGLCLIVAEESSGSGVRRIVAVTGQAAQDLARERLALLNDIAQQLGAEPDDIAGKISLLQEDLKDMRARLEKSEQDSARAGVDALVGSAKDINGIKIIVAHVTANDPDLLANLADWCRDRIASGVVVLGSKIDNKARFVVKATPDLVARGLHAGKLVGSLAKLVGGGGGGRPDFATAGGSDPSNLDTALGEVERLVAESLR